MTKLKIENLTIDDVWPASSGIGISWSANIGWGDYVLYFDENNNLHADTECMDSGKDKQFTQAILKKLVDQIIIDD